MSFNNRNENVEPSKAIDKDIEDSVNAWREGLTKNDKKAPIVIQEGFSNSSTSSSSNDSSFKKSPEKNDTTSGDGVGPIKLTSSLSWDALSTSSSNVSSTSSSEGSSHPSEDLDSEAQVSYDSDIHLSFGVEFEFKVGLEIIEGEKEKATLDDVIHCIKRDLINRGIKASTRVYETRFWNVDTDASIEANGSTRFGIEIASPAYFYDVHALAEVVQVCDTLSNNYPSSIDESCGLHVHIGYGDNGFRLIHLKNLFAFLYAFHDVLATIHPMRRRSGEGAKWCMSTRTASRLAVTNTQNGTVPESPWAALQQIYTAQDVNELVRLTERAGVMAGGVGFGKMAYKFNNLLSKGLSEKLTVEFRQHEGSLDGEASTRWIRTIAGLVEAVRRMSVDTFIDFLKRHLNNPDLNVVQLLLALGLETEAVYYSRQPGLNLSDFLPQDVEIDSPLDPANGTVGQGRIMPRKV